MLSLLLAAVGAPDPACVSRADCRFVGAVTIFTDDGTKTPALNQNMPFIRSRDGKERLWLLLGERVNARLGGPGEPGLVILRKGAAEEPADGPGEKDRIEISFQQLKGSKMTMLTVRNGYARTLEYRAWMMSGSGGESPTSICPVRPGLVSFESWPGPMIEIELSDFTLAEADQAPTVCK